MVKSRESLAQKLQKPEETRYPNTNSSLEKVKSNQIVEILVTSPELSKVEKVVDFNFMDC